MSDERIIAELKVIGYPVNKIQKGTQIVYRLADEKLMKTLPLEEKKKLAEEISKLHNLEILQQQMIANARKSPVLRTNPISVGMIPPQLNQRIPIPMTPRPPVSNPMMQMPPQVAPPVQQVNAIPQAVQELRQNFARELLRDHERVLRPDLSRFKSFQDAVERLLPYHVYQYRQKDLHCDLEKFEADGKRELFLTKAERNAIYLNEKAKYLFELSNKTLEKVKSTRDSELAVMCDKLLIHEDLQTFRRQYQEYVALSQFKMAVNQGANQTQQISLNNPQPSQQVPAEEEFVSAQPVKSSLDENTEQNDEGFEQFLYSDNEGEDDEGSQETTSDIENDDEEGSDEEEEMDEGEVGD